MLFLAGEPLPRGLPGDLAGATSHTASLTVGGRTRASLDVLTVGQEHTGVAGGSVFATAGWAPGVAGFDIDATAGVSQITVTARP